MKVEFDNAGDLAVVLDDLKEMAGLMYPMQKESLDERCALGAFLHVAREVLDGAARYLDQLDQVDNEQKQERRCK